MSGDFHEAYAEEKVSPASRNHQKTKAAMTYNSRFPAGGFNPNTLKSLKNYRKRKCSDEDDTQYEHVPFIPQRLFGQDLCLRPIDVSR
jgi:hypothetical protein